MTARHHVVLSKRAEEDFERLIRADRRLAEQIAKAIDRLASNPELGGFLKGEWKGYLKYRSGNYRIVYRVERARLIIYIITIDDRKGVYR